MSESVLGYIAVAIVIAIIWIWILRDAFHE